MVEKRRDHVTKRREVNKMYKPIFVTRNNIGEPIKVSAGHCELQDALALFERVGYNAGVYGWNYDYYRFNDVALLTGDRLEGTRIPYEVCNKINAAALDMRLKNERPEVIRGKIAAMIRRAALDAVNEK